MPVFQGWVCKLLHHWQHLQAPNICLGVGSGQVHKTCLLMPCTAQKGIQPLPYSYGIYSYEQLAELST